MSSMSKRVLLRVQDQCLQQQISRRTVTTVASQANTAQDAKPHSQIPGLKTYPLVGSFPSALRHKDFKSNTLHKFWRSMTEEYGKIVQLKLPMMAPIVAISDADDIQMMYDVTKNNPIRLGLNSVLKVRMDDEFFEKKTGILVSNNDEWWRVRSKVQTPMLKPSNILKYLPTVDRVALEFVERIAEFQRTNGEMPDLFLEEIYKWALESIGLIALNKKLGCLDPNLSPDSDQSKLIKNTGFVLESMMETELSFPSWKLIPNKPYKKLQKSHHTVLELVMKYINETEVKLKARIESGDIVADSTLLEILLQKEGLTRRDVLTMMMDLFMAGIDTTSHTIGFALFCLAKNPEAQAKLHQELDQVLGDGVEEFTSNHLAKLSFTKYCIKESLRLYPTLPLTTRTLEKDIVMCGYHIPKGYNIFALNLVSSRDEKYFYRPNEYLPERWKRDRPLGPIHPFASLPFSHGTRMCIGRRIAEQEIYTLIVRIMHRFKIDYKYDDMEISTRATMVPSQPLSFKFTERN